MLHLGFFGRILALYKRNFMRVQYLTRRLNDLGPGLDMGNGSSLEAWWNCRNFVLNDDLALDYPHGPRDQCDGGRPRPQRVQQDRHDATPRVAPRFGRGNTPSRRHGFRCRHYGK